MRMLSRLELMGLLRAYWIARVYEPSRHGELASSERRSLAERWAARHLEAELWRLEQGLAPSYVDRRLLRRFAAR
ncbi:MAG: hypothetical protein KC503_34845 [Myxococcales bacterium]|nr:hypothetical protein [Myxococcales bacterium]